MWAPRAPYADPMEADWALAEEELRVKLRRTALAVAAGLLVAFVLTFTVLRPDGDAAFERDDAAATVFWHLQQGGTKLGRVRCADRSPGLWSCTYTGRGVRCRAVVSAERFRLRGCSRL